MSEIKYARHLLLLFVRHCHEVTSMHFDDEDVWTDEDEDEWDDDDDDDDDW